MVHRSLLICAILGILSGVLASPANRVVGGKDADVGQFPFQVSLQREDGSHTCGGSIINERFILTAAHCVVVGNGVEPYPARYFQVRVGSIQRTAGGKLLQLKRIITNQKYANLINDVALLELEEPLVWSNNIKAIELATEEVPEGKDVIISGWGRLYHLGPIPHRLQYNTLVAITTETCKKYVSIAEDSVICLSHEKDHGACNGDSGGPATYEGKLVGVAGFVTGGCGSTNPDGYAKVAYHRQWILDNMK